MLSKSDAIWTVSALNFEVKTMLSKGIGTLWIEGEISNFASPASGHWYFTLKDQKAQCRAAMFKGRNNRLAFQPTNGQKVLVKAQVTLYEARGEYQLIVEHLEDVGVGELMRQYEQLKARLAEEGLFNTENKREIPLQPKKIAVVTSASGAALRDVLSVIRRRAPHIPVVICPTQVQGETAPKQIRKALAQIKTYGECDLVLLVRGGGSLEDLWCFNDEALAREIANFPIPVVAGIGHEVDFTIADFVSDLRAPTPSVAAESVTPDINELMQNIDSIVARMFGQVSLRVDQSRERLQFLLNSLDQQHPTKQFQQLKLRLDHAYKSLIEKQQLLLEHNQQRLTINQKTLQQVSPKPDIQTSQQSVKRLLEILLSSTQNKLTSKRHDLELQSKLLDGLSPLKTLARGFATVSKQQQIIHSVKQLSTGDEISIGFADGKTQATVK